MLGTAWNLIAETWSDWKDDKAARLAAALSYYTMFAIAPVVVVVIAIAGAAFGAEAVRGQVHTQIEGLIGVDGAAFVEDLMRGASRRPASTAATLFAVVMLIVGATGFFIQLQDAMNTIWEVEPRHGRRLRTILRERIARSVHGRPRPQPRSHSSSTSVFRLA